ncbi:Eukaryotic translation initiation factor NCBP [Astathelohania contejeani]|uniref:Eukaryotic translation initiation factor NCBP n=1 Tax=Astathelohania contejeani TaxID=164912 RepID=A0ABQ7I163_9MICR|nr:Eukaryotic translation initiation factor NCBP [Thelohania contejeani]
MHQLDEDYEITIVQKQNQKKDKKHDFKDCIKKICTLKTLENFSYFLYHLPRLNELSYITDINVFKAGIQPMWEDENNIAGGKLIIKVRRDLGQRLFEKLLIYMVAPLFCSIDVNGIVASIRLKYINLVIWTRTCPKDENTAEIIKEIKDAMGIDFDISVEFKNNDESLKDNSSFRNTLNITELHKNS